MYTEDILLTLVCKFGEDVQIYSSKSDGTTEVKGIRDLVPFAFCAADLREPKVEKKPIMFSQ